ncbi:hypothetical protein GCM10010177_65130 [Actinomadura citrea]|nr:hypothetical protein GCM10010177_65130 [Actinomadura citrea]
MSVARSATIIAARTAIFIARSNARRAPPGYAPARRKVRRFLAAGAQGGAAPEDDTPPRMYAGRPRGRSAGRAARR